MTVELSPYVAPNAIAFMLAHLTPLGPGGPNRVDGDPLPYRSVNRIDGADDLTLFCDNAVLSVHTFAATQEDAEHEGEITHRRILLLKHELFDVPLHGGGVANAAGLIVHQKPRLSDYRADGVFRMKAVYELDLDFT
ncbi:hypothetical protein [[Mycobacterium] crassicus]|uniref:Tail terminator n=1 Tax=[Mycobacterium] crassicus TaxID=2872309 RepID=A0ABU5XJN9_9MYCO|nr:hypothetical protein [Mycolicibacter sp. MYC098]MEB3021311.1 hypothetical protein [Mycolicibacter sp. MYC098]